MTFAPKPPPARSAPRGRAFFVPLHAVSPRTVPPNATASRRMPPRFAPQRPSLRPRPQTLQRPRPHFRLLAVQRFGHRPPPTTKPYLCIVKTKPPFPHRPTSLIPFTAMFHTALSALTAFYRTTVVILPLGHHRTLHLHTLPALLLIPYLAQLH